MKPIIYLFACLFLLACNKEDKLTNKIDFSNIYAIADDPNNAVQHERYQIFEKYEVSVYFNDTINQSYIRDDIYGNPVYRYEIVDPKWTFFNDADQRINGSIEYQYTEGEERQLKSLEMIRLFLEKTPAALHPSLILAVDAAQNINGNVTSSFNYKANFRSLLWTALADKDENTVNTEILNIKKESVESKIKNFTTQLNQFGEISDPTLYGRTYLFSFPGSDIYGYSYFLGYWASPQTFWGINTFGDYSEWLDANRAGFGFDDAYKEASCMKYTSVVGPYGFVRGSKNVRNNAPADVSEDLKWYLDLILNYSPEEFAHYWGAYPLVMKKYQILYDLIVNELGIEL